MKPAYTKINHVNIKGKFSKRLMIVLRTNGCEYAKKTGGCTVCGFMNHAKLNITENEMLEQLDYVLKKINMKGIEEIDLLTLGSFYNDNEISENFRKKALTKLSKLKKIKRITTESRAEYATLKKLKENKKIIGNKIFELGIGLESADDYIRNKIIKKGLSKKIFENFIRKVKNAGLDLFVYLLIKPQHLSEKEAIEDAVKSTRYVFKIAKKYNVYARIGFEPVFICENTPLEKLYKDGKYKLTNLWSVVEVIKKTYQLGCLFIGLSDENLSQDRIPHACKKCTKKIINEIEKFNKTQDISGLNKLNCECKKDYEYKLRRGLI